MVGQKDPTDESTYDLPYKDVNVSDYKTLEELPVFEKGCDSSYSWSKKFKHLQRSGTADEIAQRLLDVIPFDDFSNKDVMANQDIHLCFTGGEPMMKRSQQAVREILMSLRHYAKQPNNITFETNGTQPVTTEFIEHFNNKGLFPGTIFWSISPKLFTVSGEKPEKAIRPDIVADYMKASPKGQLKFVVGPQDREWEEMESVVEKFRDVGVDWPVWIMPTGARSEEQEATAGKVAEKAFKRGYNVAARVHVYLFGNAIGT